MVKNGSPPARQARWCRIKYCVRVLMCSGVQVGGGVHLLYRNHNVVPDGTHSRASHVSVGHTLTLEHLNTLTPLKNVPPTVGTFLLLPLLVFLEMFSEAG